MSTRKPTALWIKVTIAGAVQWINSAHVRRIERGYGGQCQIVFTSKDIVKVDQPLEAVMEALGYKMPPPPKLETHETPALEDHSDTPEFIAESGLSRKEP